ncbi:hypothetical protein [Alicyclobacillus acidoterrestris]|uniref:Uncharacterized protein n=1 Tax=Alicyclobacillus acidoterrestris (strain ATCC 49025 / DSM 3922 / CIP 106132 / NCIMB 13137 / GD3B) TaxID=1356854 RepID=T0C110_ALIAG|nr:hypothetical protein [Alicyclobacillus acidoterrestris]EPZ46305.1 hypothetical protein N007_07355 [Alicyclobacillus acidoterrestris ATCC 49025]UNO50683.1 hypothetical protein K1I37_09875 [Alicyclobacillus acidoterrestris]
MDSPLTRLSSSVTEPLAKLGRLDPVTRGGRQQVETPADGSGKVQTPSTTAVRGTDDQVFALERHVPLAILQNPQLLKAEWAWKLVVLQQLTLADGLMAQDDTGEPGVPNSLPNPLSVPDEAAQAETSHVSSAGAEAQQSVPTPASRPVPVAAGGQSASVNTNTPSPQASVAPQQASGMEQAEVVVRQLWNLLATATSEANQRASSVSMNFKSDPPILPFASMDGGTIATASNKQEAHKLETWVVQDRLVASVLDNPYERAGGGLFFLPPQPEQTPPYQAVKWKAQRQTKVGAAGKLIHRLRIELDVHGRALTCIVTAQRPQLLVHFVGEDVRLLSHLERGGDVVAKPLATCGWELIGWTVGTEDAEEGDAR